MTPKREGAPAHSRHQVIPIFIEVAPADIALLKFLFESYEGVAVVRTVDRNHAVIVALVSTDFIEVAQGMLNSLQGRIDFRVIDTPPGANEDWLVQQMKPPPALSNEVAKEDPTDEPDSFTY